MNRLLPLLLVVGTVLAAHAGFGFTIDWGLTNKLPPTRQVISLMPPVGPIFPVPLPRRALVAWVGALNTPSLLDSAPGLFQVSLIILLLRATEPVGPAVLRPLGGGSSSPGLCGNK